MNTSIQHRLGLCAFAFLFHLLNSGCRTVGEASIPASVARVKGAARFCIDDNLNWHELKAGQKILPGAVVQTAKAAYVDIVLRQEVPFAPRGAGLLSGVGVRYDSLRLLEDSLVKVEKMSESHPKDSKARIERFQFDLRSGRLFGGIKKVEGNSRFEILFPDAICAVRGGIFMIGAEGIVAAQKGELLVATNIAAVVRVPEGFIFDISKKEMVRIASIGHPRTAPTYVEWEQRPVIANYRRKFF